MSSDTTITGQNGKFKVGNFVIARATQWALTKTLATKTEWGDSDSAGFTNRARGRRDATFTAEGKYDTNSEQFDIFKEGDIVTAALWMNAASLYWAFPRALCDGFNMTVNMDTMEVIGWTSSWGADGPYFAPGESGAPSYTL